MCNKEICNKDIREYAKNNDIPLWRIASKLGINDGNFSRKLRIELSEEKKTKSEQLLMNWQQSSKAVMI